jgi:ferric hydroxamate transport system substrate-binding protein
MKRRAFIRSTCAAGLLPLATLAHASGTPRVIPLSWDLAEMLLSLGVTPVGLPAPGWYRSGIVEPPLPARVVDIGLLFQPNYDLLYELRPDLIVATPAHASVLASFQRIAPTITLGAYMSDARPYRAMRGEAMTLARRIGRTADADALLKQTDAAIETSRAALSGQHAQNAQHAQYAPVCIAEPVDDRHLRLYGPGSMFDELLGMLGLVNAAARDTLVKSDTSIVAMDTLARMPDANLLWIGRNNASMVQGNAVWRQLPFSQPSRTATLPMISSTGALVSVQRFARAVAHTVPSLSAHHGI